MSNENEQFDTEPIHIQDALREELDRLETASQKFIEEKQRQQEQIASQRPELYAIEERIAQLRQKEELTDAEEAELKELRVRYDTLIIGDSDETH